MKSRDVEKVNLVFLLTAILYLVASFVVSALQRDGSSLPFPALILISQFSLFIAPFLYAVQKGHFTERTGLKPLSLTNGILVMLMALCLSPLLTFVNALSQCFVKAPTTDLIIEQAKSYGFVQMFLLVALLPAFCEELVYRGVFFRTYRAQAVVPGAMLSALLFGIMHGNLNQFIYAMLMGFIFALTVYATESLVASMLMHLTINGLSTILLFAVGDSELAEESANIELTVPNVLKVYTGPAVVGSILAFLLFRKIAKRCETWDHIREAFAAEDKPGKFLRLFTLPLAITVIGMIALMIYAEFA